MEEAGWVLNQLTAQWWLVLRGTMAGLGPRGELSHQPPNDAPVSPRWPRFFSPNRDVAVLLPNSLIPAL